MPIYKECEICGDTFEANRSSQKYCKECGKHPKQSRKRYERAVNTNKRHAGDWYRVRDLTCKQCGKPFQSSYLQGFCSINCQKKYNIEHAKCSRCGKRMIDFGIEIEYQGGVHYCSKKCKEEAKWAQAREHGNVHTCAYCGSEFIRPDGTFCSTDCYRKAVKNGWKPQRANKCEEIKEDVNCRECGKIFTRNSPYIEFCSPECRKFYMKKYKARQVAEKKKNESEKKIKQMGLCWCCKTAYNNCERMSSNFQYSPEGSIFSQGKVIQCPKFTK